jgi:DNA-binding MarR family transcriptional regulator
MSGRGSGRTSVLPERPEAQIAPEAEMRIAFKAAMAAVRRLRGRQTHRPDTLSYAQYGLLFSLADGAEMAARDLAEAAELTPGTVTPMLEALEAAGLVRRYRSSNDRRVVLTGLTERGHAVVDEQRSRIEPMWRAALAGFSDDELATAAAVLRRLAAHFDELGS